MVLALDETNTVAVYGFGPWWRWEGQGIALPSPGDYATVDAKHILIGELEKYVAMSLTNTTTGEGIELRDPNTCYPYWSGIW